MNFPLYSFTVKYSAYLNIDRAVSLKYWHWSRSEFLIFLICFLYSRRFTNTRTRYPELLFVDRRNWFIFIDHKLAVPFNLFITQFDSYAPLQLSFFTALNRVIVIIIVVVATENFHSRLESIRLKLF